MKALMIDVDGVIITPRPSGWAADLERDLGLAGAVLQDGFFKPYCDLALLERTLAQPLAP